MEDITHTYMGVRILHQLVSFFLERNQGFDKRKERALALDRTHHQHQNTPENFTYDSLNNFQKYNVILLYKYIVIFKYNYIFIFKTPKTDEKTRFLQKNQGISLFFLCFFWKFARKAVPLHLQTRRE